MYRNLYHFIFYVFILCWSVVAQAETMPLTDAPAASGPPDSFLVASIQTALQKNSQTANLPVTLTVQNGIVSVAGSLATAQQAERVVQTIASVKNVKDVFVDQLTVKEDTPNLSDILMTARAKGAIAREKIFGEVDADHLPITVTTSQQIVYLRGIVDKQSQLVDTIRLLQSMKSIPRVISILDVRRYTIIIN